MNDSQKQKWFQEVIQQHRGILVKVARINCREDAEHEDLIQEISNQIWRSLDRYDDRYKLSTWLYRIALNVVISQYRKKSGRMKFTIPLTEQIQPADESNFSEKEQLLNRLEQFIRELNQFDKALMLLYLVDRSHAEISEILGISVSNVGTKVSRIKEKLKQRFSQI